MAATPLDQRERQELCELFTALGPDAPTLDEGWVTADLAAHLLARERDLLAGPGILLPRFAALTARRQARAKARGYEAVVARLRAGPPWPLRLPGVRTVINAQEWFVHHEDVRRANGLGRRTDRPDLDEALWRFLRFGTRLVARRLGDVGLVLRRPDGATRVVRQAELSATVVGHPSELVLYTTGRKQAAEVVLEGDPAAIAAVQAARFSL